MEHVPIVIAGGGIAGLAAALAAGKAGLAARVLERAADFREVGAAVQIGPNAVRVLRQLGAWDEVEAITTRPRSIVIRDALTGTRLRHVDLGHGFEARYGAPYGVALRADLHGALLTVARKYAGISVETGKTAAHWTETGATTRLVTAAGEEMDASLVVAADGIHSALRQRAWPGSAARPTGQTLYRALLDQAPAATDDADCVGLWLGPGFHAVCYAAGPSSTFNIVLACEGPVAAQDAIAASCATLATQLQAVSQWLPWPALNVGLLPSWQNGRMLVLGDAAHGTVPYFAQGAAMAVEDAGHLATLLKSGIAAALDPSRWADRRARAARVQAASLRNGQIYHLRGPVALARNMALRLMPEAAFNAQTDWLYKGP